MTSPPLDGGYGFDLDAPNPELMHSGAMNRYWNDVVFNTRAELVMNLLRSERNERTAVIYALFIDDLVRARLQADAARARLDDA